MFIPLHDANALKHIRLQYVTLAIIAANVLIWLVMGSPAMMSQETVHAAIYSFGFIPAVANGHEILPIELDVLPVWATYISYSFLHGDFLHLAGNMLFVWVFGDNVEDAMGHFRFIVFYLLCAVAGAFAHSYFSPQSDAPLIGASGAVAGIVGAYLVLHPKVRVWILALGRIPLRIPAVIVLGFWILLQIYQIIFNPGDQVSWAAHIGGIIAGMMLIVFMKRRDVPLFDRSINIIIPDTTNTSPKVATSSRPEEIADSTGKENTRTSVPKTGDKSKPVKWGR